MKKNTFRDRLLVLLFDVSSIISFYCTYIEIKIMENRHFTLAYFLGETRLSLIRSTEPEPCICVTKKVRGKKRAAKNSTGALNYICNFTESCFLVNFEIATNDILNSPLIASNTLNCQTECQNQLSCQVFMFKLEKLVCFETVLN